MTHTHDTDGVGAGSADGDGAPMPQSLSLLGGVARADGSADADALDAEPSSSRSLLSQGTLLAVLLVALSAGSLYAMRLAQAPIVINPESQRHEAVVEQALIKLSSNALPAEDVLAPSNLDAVLRDTDDIVDYFQRDMTQRQVPLDFVQKNPFTLVAVQAPQVKAANAEEEAEARRRAQLEKLKRELAKLELQSIMLGAHPVAVINNDIVQPGQKIGSFTVTEIKQFSVVFRAENWQFTLVMKNQNSGDVRRR